MIEKISEKRIRDLKALVSVLDAEHYARVEQLWADLERQFGMRQPFLTPIPHFTYQVAEDYDFEVAEARLANLTRHRAPFTIRTSGLGLFTDSSPVLYVSVIRTPALTTFHQQLHTLLRPVAQNVDELYTPRAWAPHITLAAHGVTLDQIGDVIKYLSNRQFVWEITINNVALICETCDGDLDVQTRFTLTG